MSDLKSSSPIGVFDSGMGGLTVLSELVSALPGEDFVYLGDTARVPYGSRSPGTILRYSREVSQYLLQFDIKLLVIACNTVSAHAESILREELPCPVIGVIHPGARAVASHSRTGRVGVIGTRSTIKSGAYEREIRKLNSELSIFSRACPLLVPVVEEGWMDKKLTGQILQEYLSEMVREDVDSLVLGCTHYPLLKKAIKDQYPDLRLIDSSVETARSVQQMLQERDLLHANAESKSDAAEPGSANSDAHVRPGSESGSKKAGANDWSPATVERGSVRILLTDITDHIESLERLFFRHPFQSLEEIQIDEMG
ncbi:MAG: glutamate racemase [Leptospiraceae bacterium]|nr:glutamate racemase [Leptospiraceae bacterium]